LGFETLRACGVSRERARRAVTHFKGVPGRLEKIAEKNKRTFYNDTTATTPEAATAALQALLDKEIVIIMGGSDKGLDFSPFLRELERAQACVLLPGTGSDRIIVESTEEVKRKIMLAPTMKDAVERAYTLSREGGVVLLSPGCASFGLFKNEFERGDEFVSAVHAL
ncbi:MAG: cyanophycin synthetase, partial [Candidatus Paceibacterota bacterium]